MTQYMATGGGFLLSGLGDSWQVNMTPSSRDAGRTVVELSTYGKKKYIQLVLKQQNLDLNIFLNND